MIRIESRNKNLAIYESLGSRADILCGQIFSVKFMGRVDLRTGDKCPGQARLVISMAEQPVGPHRAARQAVWPAEKDKRLGSLGTAGAPGDGGSRVAIAGGIETWMRGGCPFGGRSRPSGSSRHRGHPPISMLLGPRAHTKPPLHSAPCVEDPKAWSTWAPA